MRAAAACSRSPPGLRHSLTIATASGDKPVVSPVSIALRTLGSAKSALLNLAVRSEKFPRAATSALFSAREMFWPNSCPTASVCPRFARENAAVANLPGPLQRRICPSRSMPEPQSRRGRLPPIKFCSENGSRRPMSWVMVCPSKSSRLSPFFRADSNGWLPRSSTRSCSVVLRPACLLPTSGREMRSLSVMRLSEPLNASASVRRGRGFWPKTFCRVVSTSPVG